MVCSHKKYFECYVLGKDTAEHFLEQLGFDKEQCSGTFSKDGRYGTIEKDCVLCDFANSVIGRADFGKYVIVDGDCGACFSNHIILMNKEDFEREYELLGDFQ